MKTDYTQTRSILADAFRDLHELERMRQIGMNLPPRMRAADVRRQLEPLRGLARNILDSLDRADLQASVDEMSSRRRGLEVVE